MVACFPSGGATSRPCVCVSAAGSQRGATTPADGRPAAQRHLAADVGGPVAAACVSAPSRHLGADWTRVGGSDRRGNGKREEHADPTVHLGGERLVWGGGVTITLNPDPR